MCSLTPGPPLRRAIAGQGLMIPSGEKEVAEGKAEDAGEKILGGMNPGSRKSLQEPANTAGRRDTGLRTVRKSSMTCSCGHLFNNV